MSERYTKVYECPQNVYAENSPVVISAGALLKDNQTGKILAQLKIKNITNKVIKAARISILSFDTVGNLIDGKTTYEYLDLSADRDCEFGQKVPIILPNDSARAFSVKINEIIFNDNSIWKDDAQEWEPLKGQTKLISALNDSESIKQFKHEYGENCEYVVSEEKDIWICSCGKINKKEELTCFNCNNSLAVLKNIDFAKLVDSKNARIENEKEEKAQNRKKKYKITGIIVALIVCIIAISTVVITTNKIAEINKEKAEAYSVAEQMFQEGKYFKAYELYTQASGYKDSIEKTNQAALHYLALEINFYDYTYNTGDLRNLYGAVDVSPAEMKKILTSNSWATRIIDAPSYIAHFSEDGSVSPEGLGVIANIMLYYKWREEADCLTFIGRSESEKNFFNFLKMDEGLYLAYKKDNNVEVIRQVFIEKDSKWYDKYMERYSAEIKEWKEKQKK